MRKLILIFAFVVVAITLSAQTATISMNTYAKKVVDANYTLTNGVADTFLFNANRSYPVTQTYSVNLDSLTGNHTNIAVALYGSELGTVTWTQVGSTINWLGKSGGVGGLDTTIIISNTTANKYNYYRAIITGTGTGTTRIDQQIMQTWSTALSDGVATLSNGSFTGIANITGTGDIVMAGGDFTGKNSDKLDIGEVADAQFTLTRNDAGIVTLTSADNDANAALTIGAGGTGALTLGDVGSTTAMLSSGWTVASTGITTGLLQTVIVNTDESETLSSAQSGVVVTTDGAATVTIPDPSAATIGVIYYILQTADDNLIITATTANSNSIVCDGVATSDAVTISTASHKIGAGMIVIGISATQWYVGGLNPESVLTPEAAD
jgi:hypothetical protein